MIDVEDTVPEWTQHEKGDYLLVDRHGVVQATSGNTDFWDVPGLEPPELDAYVVLKVVEVVRG